MKLLVFISTLGILTSTIYYLAAIVAGLLFAHRANSAPQPLPKIPPRVAILKPLRGVSEHLRENIISFLEIAYSRVEYIFGVDSYEDRAIDVPVSLRAPYQFANITVTVGDEPGCSNRKVAKLVKMAAPRIGQDRHLRAQRCRHFGRARSSQAGGVGTHRG